MDLSDLVQQLKSEDSQLRHAAAEMLSQQPEIGRLAITDLVRACADDDEAVRQCVSSALEDLGPPNTDEVNDLAAVFVEVPNPDSGFWAATMLGRLGNDASPAVDQLVSAMSSSPYANVRQRAAWALGKIGMAAAMAQNALQAAAEGDDPRLARIAKSSLGQIQ